jgi:acetoacetyl-CoA synthetase
VGRYCFYSSTSRTAWNYLVGGLLHGTSIVLYDESRTYPDQSVSWAVAAATRATTFGTGAECVTECEPELDSPRGGHDHPRRRGVVSRVAG